MRNTAFTNYVHLVKLLSLHRLIFPYEKQRSCIDPRTVEKMNENMFAGCEALFPASIRPSGSGTVGNNSVPSMICWLGRLWSSTIRHKHRSEQSPLCILLCHLRRRARWEGLGIPLMLWTVRTSQSMCRSALWIPGI